MTLDEAMLRVVRRGDFDGALMDEIDSSRRLSSYILTAVQSDCENPNLVQRVVYTCIRVGQEMGRDREDQVLYALRGAVQALRSYQYGNSSPHLAEEVADVAETILSAAEMGARHG